MNKTQIISLEQFITGLIDKCQILFEALLILIIGLYLCKCIRKLISKSFEKSKIDPSVASFINSLIKFLLWILLGIIVVTKLGVDTTSIVALITSASLAIGLALQGSLANLAGSVMILVMKPFKIGDYINDGCGHEGTVVGIEIIYTRLLTADNQTIHIPNGKLADSTITNLTHQDIRRIDFPVGIDYSENIDSVRHVMEMIINNHPLILNEPEPFVFVDSFDSSSVKIVLRLWCKTENYWSVKFEIQELIKKKFDEEQITIPYEHMDIQILHQK